MGAVARPPHPLLLPLSVPGTPILITALGNKGAEMTTDQVRGVVLAALFVLITGGIAAAPLGLITRHRNRLRDRTADESAYCLACPLTQGAIYVTDNAAYTWTAAVQETVDATLNRTVSSGGGLRAVRGGMGCPNHSDWDCCVMWAW